MQILAGYTTVLVRQLFCFCSSLTPYLAKACIFLFSTVRVEKIKNVYVPITGIRPKAFLS